jgi:hypothetical protein
VTTASAAARQGAAAMPAAVVEAGSRVLPGHITAGHAQAGPRFGDDVWDVRPFVPRTTRTARTDFTTLTDPGQVRTAKEYLYSRIHRGIPANYLGAASRPMKITNLYGEFGEVRAILRDLAAAGAPRLADVTSEHLQSVLAGWRHCPDTAAGLVGVIKHIAAHGPFLTDRLIIIPWPGRGANMAAGRVSAQENTTSRIPGHITAPLIKAAVFYVETAAGDLLAARAGISALAEARSGIRLGKGQARGRLEAFVAARRGAGRGIPALPRQTTVHHAGIPVTNGVMQAPNQALISLLAGVPGGTWYHKDLLTTAGDQLGYEEGGLDTTMSAWPGAGQPRRPRLNARSLTIELSHLRTASWILRAYLSGMRDAEVRELAPDCAFTEPGADGRVRYKRRGRVFKDRALTGDHAEWVVLELVRTAVDVLRRINDPHAQKPPPPQPADTAPAAPHAGNPLPWPGDRSRRATSSPAGSNDPLTPTQTRKKDPPMTSPDIDHKIQAALQRLTCGRPEVTDGQLTISGLCAEAGVSRASFYRSPQAEQIKKLISDPVSPRPETEELRAEVKKLKNTEKTLRGQHAGQVRELREQVKTYANQIQVLALRLAQLDEDNQRPHSRLERAGDNVTALPARR